MRKLGHHADFACVPHRLGGPRTVRPGFGARGVSTFGWNLEQRGTDVFRSRFWNRWTEDDYVGHIQAHAAEVIRDENGDWFVSHAGIYRGGLYLLPLHWRDD